MSEQKATYTPGPWKHSGYAVIVKNTDERICITGDYSTDYVSGEHIANARFIAAAPLLYEALKETVIQYHDLQNMLRMKQGLPKQSFSECDYPSCQQSRAALDMASPPPKDND